LAAADLALFRGLDVNAPPEILFRWLCQLRIAPYSYDWLDNFGRRSPRTLTPGLERLEVGQHVMALFELVEFETDRHITAITLPTIGESLFGRFACSYVVMPRRDDGAARRSRLLVKLVARRSRGPLGLLMSWTLPWGDLVMMRKQLYNLKALAESSAPETAQVVTLSV
jgi:hypothetical protein